MRRCALSKSRGRRRERRNSLWRRALRVRGVPDRRRNHEPGNRVGVSRGSRSRQERGPTRGPGPVAKRGRATRPRPSPLGFTSARLRAVSRPGSHRLGSPPGRRRQASSHDRRAAVQHSGDVSFRDLPKASILRRQLLASMRTAPSPATAERCCARHRLRHRPCIIRNCDYDTA